MYDFDCMDVYACSSHSHQSFYFIFLYSVPSLYICTNNCIFCQRCSNKQTAVSLRVCKRTNHHLSCIGVTRRRNNSGRAHTNRFKNNRRKKNTESHTNLPII